MPSPIIMIDWPAYSLTNDRQGLAEYRLSYRYAAPALQQKPYRQAARHKALVNSPHFREAFPIKPLAASPRIGCSLLRHSLLTPYPHHKRAIVSFTSGDCFMAT